MRFVKKALKFISILLLIIISLLYVFDYEYILKGARVVYLTGHKTAFIDDLSYFDTNTINKGATQEWPLHKNYNKLVPTKNLTEINKDLGTVAFIIVKNDSIHYENYTDGYSNESLTNSFSMSKSMVTALLFKAIDEGYIKSLNTKVISFLPEISGEFSKELTVGDLSSMSSGLNWNENYSNPFSLTARAYYDDNLRETILKLKVVDKPGQSFNYLSGATQMLGMVLEKATKVSLSEYLSNSFWKPMGMNKDALWQIDDKTSNLEKAYCCVASSARDFGRFGQLWLHNGKWKGQQLIPEYLAKLAQQNRFKESPNYGYGLWLSDYRNKKISYMRGILGQYVICIPEDNMIIVRLGHKRSGIDTDPNLGNDFETYIDASYDMLNQLN